MHPQAKARERVRGPLGASQGRRAGPSHGGRLGASQGAVGSESEAGGRARGGACGSLLVELRLERTRLDVRNDALDETGQVHHHPGLAEPVGKVWGGKCCVGRGGGPSVQEGGAGLVVGLRVRVRVGLGLGWGGTRCGAEGRRGIAAGEGRRRGLRRAPLWRAAGSVPRILLAEGRTPMRGLAQSI